MPTHNTCFIFAVKVAQDVEDVLADFVRHGNLSMKMDKKVCERCRKMIPRFELTNINGDLV
jgi:hypothetical protein